MLVGGLVAAGGVRESGSDVGEFPEHDRVGDILEELADDLPSDAGIGRPFDLHKRRDAILVNQHVVDPADVSGVTVERNLARDHQPAPRVSGINQLAREQFGMAAQKGLEDVLALEALFA